MKIDVTHIIAGFTKCGTSSLFQWLADHPEVQGSIKKEVQYFMDRNSSRFHPESNYLDHGLTRYNQFWTTDIQAQTQVILEATPGYAYQTCALEALSSDSCKHIKLIFIVRNPLDQLQSTFEYFKNNWAELPLKLTFEKFVADQMSGKGNTGNEFVDHALEFAQFGNFLNKWQDQCGKDRIIVKKFEDMKRDPMRFMKILCNDLGMDQTFYNDYTFERQNVTVEVKNQLLHKAIIKARKILPRNKITKALGAAYNSLNLDTSAEGRANPVELNQRLVELFTPTYKWLDKEYDINYSEKV
ncbi:MAG: sulfotransferase domain-containing protein [Cyclobacteriaceae bacterium]